MLQVSKSQLCPHTGSRVGFFAESRVTLRQEGQISRPSQLLQFVRQRCSIRRYLSKMLLTKATTAILAYIKSQAFQELIFGISSDCTLL